MRSQSNKALSKNGYFRNKLESAEFLLIWMKNSFAAKSPPISSDSIPGLIISLLPVSKANQARSQMRKESKTSLFAKLYYVPENRKTEVALL